jgi:hypothetical protein
MLDDPVEDPVVDEPELGDDVEGNYVADELVSVLVKLGGELGSRGGINELCRIRHVELQDEQRDSDGHHAIGQGK